MSRRADQIHDDILILEYRAGDIGALEKLISRWQARIYWYILTLVQEEEAAWDVSQDVWLAGITGLGKRVPPRNFSAWLYRMAHNKAVSYLRRKGRLKERRALSPEPADWSSEDEDPFDSAEKARLVHACLRELPLAQREVLGLFYLKEHSLDEIAQILDLALGTVQSRLHYGRIRMKEALLRKGYRHEQR